ncbi:hypothetical protein [Alkalibacterium thalassium]|uniref:Uncharacterized protein n=1 Tax=Alkalibacterium thalassium TaxID=426701 RepID=A0A1G9ETZ9_9LACT|nr:hypothetical protein [Alkalibacterium thalassium]SDK79642.1 hypothetical protein SAMN04488098_10677 [Alkalibacterium thalassium]
MDNEKIKKDLKSFKYSYIFGMVAILFLMIIRTIHHESSSDLLLIITAKIAAVSWVQSSDYTRKGRITIIIMFLIALGLAIASLLTEYGVY